jgi:A/G-specific adenine glycosylase
MEPMPAQADALLAWYDRHRRALPWRALPDEAADPYRVWLSEIMLQQTTVQAVKGYFVRFLERFPTVEALAAAPSEQVMSAWAGLGYYSRARNLHACAQAIMTHHDGRFPDTEAGLRALPGIGAYTSAAVAAIAFNRKAAAVDGNVERVMTRLHRIATPLPAAKAVVREVTLALVPEDRPGDFAQALMDLGATICTPRAPACGLCPWREPCAARAAGDMLAYPVKARKREGATRFGVAYVVLRADGALLVGTRAPKGLLGGMTEVPGSAWMAGNGPPSGAPEAPLAADWVRANVPVRHVFTHFPLELTVLAARVGADSAAPEGLRFVPGDRLDEAALPTVMRKAIAAGLALLGAD